jgi:hypothetical protein
MLCLPYCKRCSNERIAISSPNSSAIATIAIPSTAGPWWVSPCEDVVYSDPEDFEPVEKRSATLCMQNLIYYIIVYGKVYKWYDYLALTEYLKNIPCSSIGTGK